MHLQVTAQLLAYLRKNLQVRSLAPGELGSPQHLSRPPLQLQRQNPLWVFGSLQGRVGFLAKQRLLPHFLLVLWEYCTIYFFFLRQDLWWLE